MFWDEMATIITIFKKLDKWALIIGFLTVIILSTFHFLFNFYSLFTYLYLSYPLVFITSCIIELLSKSNNAIDGVLKGISTGFYEFLIYLLIYWVGYEIIVKQAWEDLLFVHNWMLLFIPAIVMAILSFIPVNIAGSLIIYKIRRK